MSKPETLLLTPRSSLEVISASARMFTDLQVGGFVMKNIVDQDTVAELTEIDGKGFSQHEALTNIFSLVSMSFAGGAEGYTVQETGTFIWSHDWHIAGAQAEPMVRTWLHLRGQPEFWLARASHTGITGYDLDESDVLSNAYADPVCFTPDLGDAIFFIDRGTPGITGTSTLHKVDVPGQLQTHQKRMSVGCDVTFSVM